MPTSVSISVVIPAYNRAELVGQTLRSLLNQTLPAYEIIVVDDGSTDGTEEAAWSAFHQWEGEKVKGEKVPEFKVIRQENAGPGAARNRGFAESKRDFVHFFDSDDIAAPNKHEVQVRALQEIGADIAYGPWVKGYIKEHEAWSAEHGVEGGGRGGRRYSFEPEGHVLQQKGLPKGDLIKELLTRWSIVPQACMFRRSIIEKSGGFPDDMFVAEDQLMFLRCLLAGARVVSTPQTLTFYRLGSAGKLTESHEARDRRVSDWLLFLERADEECRLHRINPQHWFHYNRRLWSAARDATKASEFTMDDGRWDTAMRGLLFMAASCLRRWRSGLKRRVIGRRSESCFRAGPLRADQAKLFPTCVKSRD
jgi:glycosyltransferase involved in cell wall biosynthesis